MDSLLNSVIKSGAGLTYLRVLFTLPLDLVCQVRYIEALCLSRKSRT